MTDKTLIQYDVQDGVAVLTLDDPPANTYTHEMMVQLDQAILRARFDRGRGGDRGHGSRREVLLRRSQHPDAL